MKLQSLVELSLILILVSNSKGQLWEINVARIINAELGSNVAIPCTFKYPPNYHTENVQIYWKTTRKGYFTDDPNDQNKFIYHPNDSYVEEKYRGKTKLIGDKDNGNCSLKITNITDDDQFYLRIIVKNEKYSFKEKIVTANVSGSLVPNNTGPRRNDWIAQMHVAIIVPVTAVLIIIFIIGCIFFRRRRSQSFTREESGYYANFSTASSNQAKREELCKKQDIKELPDLKAIDEPVYMNVEDPAGQMDQNMDHTDNVYANVDYSK